MSLIEIVWLVLQIIIGYQLIVPLVFYAIYLLAGRKIKLIELNSTAHIERDYAIIVTAFEQTTLLPQVVASILKVNYSNYLIYVVADNCDISDLNFDSDKVILLKPDTVLASNTKSHFYAINNFKREHDVLTIIDSDNLVDTKYINELNPFFDAGYEAVQGVRAAKNLDTTYACLDAARDIYYHYYDGKILFAIGSSATLTGSGMAFRVSLYKHCLEKLNIEGAGFDKVLQAEIVKRDIRIAFAEHAIVYDQKTAHADQLVNQRARWINTWFKYFALGFNILSRSIKNLSINQFLFGIVIIRPPLFLFIIASLVCCFIDLFFFPAQSIIWLIAIGIFIFSFYLSLSKGNTDSRIYRSLINIPNFVYLQLISLIYARGANKRSVATKHHSDV
jgi:cellulose synthase/poly-beta-1,6-N-acetylglucosamine synthase-like glycosyltransferase